MKKFKEYEKYSTRICAGMNELVDDFLKLEQGIQVILGTPGRIHALSQKSQRQQKNFFKNVKIFVLYDIEKILRWDFNVEVFEIMMQLPESVKIVAFCQGFVLNEFKQEIHDLFKDKVFEKVFILPKQNETIFHQSESVTLKDMTTEKKISSTDEEDVENSEKMSKMAATVLAKETENPAKIEEIIKELVKISSKTPKSCSNLPIDAMDSKDIKNASINPEDFGPKLSKIHPTLSKQDENLEKEPKVCPKKDKKGSKVPALCPLLPDKSDSLSRKQEFSAGEDKSKNVPKKTQIVEKTPKSKKSRKKKNKKASNSNTHEPESIAFENLSSKDENQNELPNSSTKKLSESEPAAEANLKEVIDLAKNLAKNSEIALKMIKKYEMPSGLSKKVEEATLFKPLKTYQFQSVEKKDSVESTLQGMNTDCVKNMKTE